MSKNVEGQGVSPNDAKPVLYAVGTAVRVVANVDYVGEVGTIVSLEEKGRHPIKVQFGDTWACYSNDELELANSV